MMLQRAAHEWRRRPVDVLPTGSRCIVYELGCRQDPPPVVHPYARKQYGHRGRTLCRQSELTITPACVTGCERYHIEGAEAGLVSSGRRLETSAELRRIEHRRALVFDGDPILEADEAARDRRHTLARRANAAPLSGY